VTIIYSDVKLTQNAAKRRAAEVTPHFLPKFGRIVHTLLSRTESIAFDMC